MTDNKLLLRQIKDDPERVFNQLVDQYQQRLYWHVRRMVVTHENADDVIQNVMIKVWKHLPSFNGSAAIYTWMYRIATNESLNHLKKKKLKTVDSGFESNPIAAIDQLKSDPWFTTDEILGKLHLAISKLPDNQRAVFNLKYFDDLKYDEISEITGTSVGGLKANYHHAVKKIKSFFEAN